MAAVASSEFDRSVQQVLRRLHRWLGALMLGISLLFLAASWRQQASLRTVFDDRVVPLYDLQRISVVLNVNVPATLQADPDAVAPLGVHAAELRRIWAKYLQTYLTPEEKELARDAGTRLLTLADDLERRRGAGFFGQVNAVNGALAPLLDLQVRVAREELRSTQVWGAIGLVGALLSLGGVWFAAQHAREVVRRQVVEPLHQVAQRIAGLASPGVVHRQPPLTGDFAEVGEQLDRLEAQLSERDALQSRTESLLQQLQGAHKDLMAAEKMSSLGSMAAAVSHEINTPLGVAVTVSSSLVEQTQSVRAELHTGQLRRSLLEGLLHSLDDGLALLQRNLERTAQLLRNFKQVAVDRSGMVRRSFDLRATVEELLASLRVVHGRNGADFRNELPAGILCDGYPGELGQVISNLVVNAAVHGFGGGAGQLTVRLAARSADAVELRIEDNGRGMKPEVLAHAFDPYFSTRMAHGGSGLGLAIARELSCDVLGGRLTVQSQEGEGTCFVLHLPLSAPQREAMPPAPLLPA